MRPATRSAARSPPTCRRIREGRHPAPTSRSWPPSPRAGGRQRDLKWSIAAEVRQAGAFWTLRGPGEGRTCCDAESGGFVAGPARATNALASPPSAAPRRLAGKRSAWHRTSWQQIVAPHGATRQARERPPARGEGPASSGSSARMSAFAGSSGRWRRARRRAGRRSHWAQAAARHHPWHLVEALESTQPERATHAPARKLALLHPRTSPTCLGDDRPTSARGLR